MITATINDTEVRVEAGTTILEAAQSVGIEIPTLCYSPDLKPSGNCRVCVVEVEGARTLVGACHTPLSTGMVIRTDTAKVIMVRKATIELLMAAHTGECVTDEHTGACALRKLADHMESGSPRFLMRRPRWYPVEATNPYVLRDMSRCILCRKCISVCTEIAGKNVYSLAYRGFATKVVVGFDDPLTTDVCRDCGICIDYCPTGALSKPLTAEGEKK
ncbi:MAG: (2Fe-2S)-binding protein [Anaerolineales bacterium]|nr:(2Fe-2S)-binding protein [Desulfobacteraceae bacterium]MCK4962681.1 (2Fe-2S)-binding protein [Anaerolineales bacterium]